MTRKRKRLFGCLLPVLVVFLLLVVFPLISFVQGPRRELGDHTLSILRGADRVETFRLDDSRDGEDVPMRQEIADYPLLFQGHTLGPPFAAKLAHLLGDSRTYLGPNDVSCLINPGVAFRAWRGHECVEVIICFHCQQMLVTTKDARGHVTHSAYTEITWMRAEFIALAKETFPDDKELQALI